MPDFLRKLHSIRIAALLLRQLIPELRHLRIDATGASW